MNEVKTTDFDFAVFLLAKGNSLVTTIGNESNNKKKFVFHISKEDFKQLKHSFYTSQEDNVNSGKQSHARGLLIGYLGDKNA